jgi:hypothetical protein
MGKYKTKIKHFPGEKFGDWTVIKEVDIGNGRGMFLCQCVCGEESLVFGYKLRNGGSTKCRKCSGVGILKHGMHKAPEYQAYMNMIKRCSSKPGNDWDNYGRRDIKVCDEWLGDGGYLRFYEHVGPRPSPKHSLDRVNVMGNYEPGNVRWATQSEQNFNKRKVGDLSYFCNKELIMEIYKRNLIQSSFVVGLFNTAMMINI